MREVRVVVVDDHRILREGLVSMLASEPGLRVVGQAANGLEAVRLVETLRPDVVTMDVTMPVMNGVEATARIARACPRVAVVGLSMHAAEDMERKMREAGAVAYLAKDAALDELARVIREAAGAVAR